MSGGQPFQGTFWNRYEVLEAFENMWDRGIIPHISEVLDATIVKCPQDELADTVSDLIQIDMERRWRSNDENVRFGLSHYLEMFPSLFDKKLLTELICWEYRVRNQWGDCILKERLCRQYPDLGDELFDRLDQVAASLVWPKVEVVGHGQSAMEALLDRPVEAGRQRSIDSKPWSVITTRLAHRFVLCESTDSSLSRQQLRLTLHSMDTVLIQNISANRAIAVRSSGAIDAGQSLICRLPADIHLGDSRYLRIGTR